MSEVVAKATDENFDAEVLQSAQPVIVDFWAEWCGPCKMFAPVFEEVAQDYQGRLKFMKVNVDENSELPVKYNVRGIPNIIIFKDGAVVANEVRAMTKSQLTAFIDSNL